MNIPEIKIKFNYIDRTITLVAQEQISEGLYSHLKSKLDIFSNELATPQVLMAMEHHMARELYALNCQGYLIKNADMEWDIWQ